MKLWGTLLELQRLVDTHSYPTVAPTASPTHIGAEGQSKFITQMVCRTRSRP